MMTFIILMNSRNRRGSYTPGPPLSSLEKVIVAIVVAIVVTGAAVGITFGLVAQSHWNAHQKAMRLAWDKGVGIPAATQVTHGATVLLTPSITEVNEYWDGCSSNKTCWGLNIPYYPNVIAMHDLSLSHGCFTIEVENHVQTLMATSRVSEYTLRWTSTGAHLIICTVPGKGGNHGDVVLWSDNPGASR